MKREYISSSPAQTKKLGEKFAKEILETKTKIIGLTGELGGGKTTFLQGFARGLGIKEKITSPTFVIMKKFQVSSSKFQEFYHIDCYRIKKSKELLDLGFKEIISNPRNIVTIEWSDKVKKIIPKNTIRVKFDFIDIRKRKILFENFMLK